ncbi:hypothetical protein D3C78_1936220 [compost metagenome]
MPGSRSLTDAHFQLADAVDPSVNDVARLQHIDTCRAAGHDQVTGPECYRLRDAADDFTD